MRALLIWELGGGLGHMMNLRPLAAEMVARGHEVYLAAGDLTRAVDVFGEFVEPTWASLSETRIPVSEKPAHVNPSPRPSPARGEGEESSSQWPSPSGRENEDSPSPGPS